MEQVRLSGGKINSVSAVVGVDGEEILRDKTKGPQVYTNYLKSIVADKNSFIRDELLLLITKIMPAATQKHLTSSLEFLSDNYFKKDHKRAGRAGEPGQVLPGFEMVAHILRAVKVVGDDDAALQSARLHILPQRGQLFRNGHGAHPFLPSIDKSKHA
jgi:hypothetical protein